MLAVAVSCCLCIVAQSQIIEHCMERYIETYESGPNGPSVPLYARAEPKTGIHRADDAHSEVLTSPDK